MSDEPTDSDSASEVDVTEPGTRHSPLERARELFEIFLEEAIARAEELDVPAEEFLGQFKGAEMLNPVVDAFYDAVLEQAPRWADEANQYHAGFLDRMRHYYADALDGFNGFVDLCVQSAAKVNERGTGKVDATGELLLDLHARACLVAREIHTLLANGYPWGALASWRTVHELAVIATILDEHGRANDADLTERWIAHDAVIHYQDATIYQDRAERLDYEPLTEEELERLRQNAAEAEEKFGPSIRNRNGYGWAAEVCKPNNPSFARLEELAGLDHLRGHYRWASHRVHGDSRGNQHNLIEYRGQTFRLAGPTNLGLLDAADLTLSSLWIATNYVLSGLRDEDPEPEEVVMMLTLGKLKERISDAFVAAEQAVEEAEAAYLAELQGEDSNN